MIENIKNLKKIELHLHLDGSVEISTLSKISGINEDDLRKDMIANDKCQNLSEYLTKFDLPISYMQTKDNLRIVAKDLVNYLEKENVIYAEIRFAPMFHTRNGLDYEDIIEAVLEGLNSNKKVKTNLILCMMRGFSKEDNIKTIEVARRYLNKGVCAIDLAGAEDKYPLDDYFELFELVKSYGIPFTVHAGENGDYNEVNKAIKIGAKRIGHGIHSIDSLDTLNLVKDKNVLLEVCPTSNVQTNSVSTYNSHPINKLYNNGLKISISTDNKTVSNISLTNEYIKLYECFGFTLEDFKKMNLDALQGAFLTEYEKEELRLYFR